MGKSNPDLIGVYSECTDCGAQIVRHVRGPTNMPKTVYYRCAECTARQFPQTRSYHPRPTGPFPVRVD